MKITNTIFATTLFALCCVGSAHATTISVSPTTQQAAIGNQFQVDLTIAGVNSGTVPALGAWDINLSFDPSLVSFQNAVFGNQLDVLGLGDIQSVSFLTADTIELFEISLDTAADLTALQASNFSLATLSFNALADGTSPLAIGINALADANGSALAANVVNGNVSIGAGPGLPEPGTLMLLVLAVGALAVAARPRIVPTP